MKKSARICLLIGVASGVLPALGLTANVRLAPMLPEVEKHIAEAHSAMDRGDYGNAEAHASAVLIGNEITYVVSYVSTRDADQPSCLKALKAAMDVWSRALDGQLHFREVALADHPEISIVFKPSVHMGQEQVAGYTSWERKIDMDGSRFVDTTFHADMQLRNRDLNFHTMSFEAMRHEACHEFGHVLGLDDSDHRGDLMGPLEISHPVSGPTDIEAASVKSLREEAAEIQTEAQHKETGKTPAQ